MPSHSPLNTAQPFKHISSHSPQDTAQPFTHHHRLSQHLTASCILPRGVIEEGARCEELESIKANPEPTDTIDNEPCNSGVASRTFKNNGQVRSLRGVARRT
ncbi:hypothetical protein E2C01_040701 [Portunus trituberculatus]|uniref:Uncharacterized protein n=1 Tax=Portunus trituberculatus TaxID=210409 RepID=A0A5B7FNX9_PORTR|nr:hypothetical protein [Portunus trituberculatus]